MQAFTKGHWNSKRYSPNMAPPTSVLHLLKEPSETFVVQTSGSREMSTVGEACSNLDQHQQSLEVYNPYDFQMSHRLQMLNGAKLERWKSALAIKGVVKSWALRGFCVHPSPGGMSTFRRNPQTTGYLLGWTCTISQIHWGVERLFERPQGTQMKHVSQQGTNALSRKRIPLFCNGS